MMHLSWLEVFGYAASVVVAVSLMMGSIVKLRWYNLFGALGFSIYGALIHAYPVAVLNGFIAIADLYYLIQIYRDKGAFDVLPVSAGSSYAAHFLAARSEEIKQLFPAFDGRLEGDRVGFYVLRDLVPAGLFVAAPTAQGDLEVLLDYVLPAYRDFKPGRHVYDTCMKQFRAQGFERLVARTDDPRHADYLRRMGFQATGDGEGRRLFVLGVN